MYMYVLVCVYVHFIAIVCRLIIIVKCFEED